MVKSQLTPSRVTEIVTECPVTITMKDGIMATYTGSTRSTYFSTITSTISCGGCHGQHTATLVGHPGGSTLTATNIANPKSTGSSGVQLGSNSTKALSTTSILGPTTSGIVTFRGVASVNHAGLPSLFLSLCLCLWNYL